MADCLFCRIVAGEVPSDGGARHRRGPTPSGTSTRRRRCTCWSCPAATSLDAGAVQASDGAVLAEMFTTAQAGGRSGGHRRAAATAWCSTSATTPSTPSPTSTCTSSAVSAWAGRPADPRAVAPAAAPEQPGGASGSTCPWCQNACVHDRHRHRPQPPHGPPGWALSTRTSGWWRTRSAAPASSPGATSSPSTATTPTVAARSVEELRLLLEQGHAGRPPGRAPHHRHGARPTSAPPRCSPPRCCARPGAASVRPKTSGQKRYADAIAGQHHHLRHRPGRHRQELPGRRPGRAGPAGQAGRPHHPHPARRSRPASASGFLPGDLMAKIDPYLRPALRRPLRHARHRGGPPAARGRAPSRSRRWPTCGAARSTTASSSSTRPRTPRPSR